MKNYVILFFLIGNLIGLKGFGSYNTNRIGDPFIMNYPPSLYQSGRQNWDLCMGENGLMYFANGPLLEGGHQYWNVHHLHQQSPSRSLCRMTGNNILVGGPGMFGVAKGGHIPGEMTFYSLLDRLDSAYHQFGTVWDIEQHQDAWYFRAGLGIFKYANDTIVPLMFGELIDFMQFQGDTLFVQVARKGLGIFYDGSFQLLPVGEAFSTKKVIGVYPVKNDQWLIITSENGVYIAGDHSLEKYTPLSIDEIIESQISAVHHFGDGVFAIGTVKNGLYVVDLDGNIIQHTDRSSGLQNNTIISMFADESNNLWLGLDNGISFIELNSCLSSLTSDIDIGTGYVSTYFDGYMYLGTNQGLYYVEWDIDKPGNIRSHDIKPVQNTTGQVWTLFSREGKLYCGHHKGLFEIRHDNSYQVGEMEGCWQIDYLDQYPDHFLVSTYRGFYVLKFDEAGGLVSQIRIEDIPSNPRTFMQDDQGFFWVVTPEQDLYRFGIDINRPEKLRQLKNFSQYRGMDPYEKIRLVGNNRKVFFSTDHGLYNYSYVSDHFVENTVYNQIIGDDERCSEFFEDEHDRIWYVKDSEIGYFPLQFGHTSKVNQPFNKILDTYTMVFGMINVVDEENILFGVENGFYHYQSNCIETIDADYLAYIVDVHAHEPPVKWVFDSESGKEIPVFRHQRNAFEFFFTSNFFETKRVVQYAYMLLGYDQDWSEWGLRNSKEYNNLFEGTYTLLLKAQTSGGITAGESGFTFIISPPFYRSKVAFILYLFLIFVGIYFLRRYLVRRLEAEKHKVENRKQLEMEYRKKKFDEEQLLAKQRITELENEKLHQDLTFKSKELSNSMINLLHMNENLGKIKSDLQRLSSEQDVRKRDGIYRQLVRFINSQISTPRYMELFDLNFSAVHEDFINNLKERHPHLSQNDIKLCAFLKMNKSTKEIASLLNISTRGVETSRHRLRKKMGLSRDENLYTYISSM